MQEAPKSHKAHIFFYLLKRISAYYNPFKIISLFTQTYIVGTQKNHLIEMVLLSTHNICFG